MVASHNTQNEKFRVSVRLNCFLDFFESFYPKITGDVFWSIGVTFFYTWFTSRNTFRRTGSLWWTSLWDPRIRPSLDMIWSLLTKLPSIGFSWQISSLKMFAPNYWLIRTLGRPFVNVKISQPWTGPFNREATFAFHLIFCTCSPNSVQKQFFRSKAVS